MPWTWLARILLAGALYWVAQRRAQGGAIIDGPTVRRHVDTTLEAGMLLARAITVATLAVGGVLLLTVAGSTLILGPRWIGIAAAAVTAVFVVAAVQEGFRLRAELIARRLRHQPLHVVADPGTETRRSS
jgi:hypothetical protein